MGNRGGISGAGKVRQGRGIALSLAAGKTLSLDTRVPGLGAINRTGVCVCVCVCVSARACACW